ncbi:alpha/beta hydrolase [Ramlibacter sp.]|uniref:alpha/beta hydrolase n=1 Tax=Ramlibacter sp. TaxID=1917967 RepID=UPI003D0B538D
MTNLDAPTNDAMRVEQIAVRSSLGFEVYADLRRPPEGVEPLGVALFCHGFSGTKYATLTTRLAAAGYITVSIDFPGYGATLPGSGRVLPEEQVLIVREFGEDARKRFAEGLPIILVGASLGAAVALLAAQQDPRFGAAVLAHPLATGIGFLRLRYPDADAMAQFWAKVEAAKRSGDRLHRTDIAALPNRLTNFLPGDTAMTFVPEFATQFAAVSVLGVIAALAPMPVLALHCDGDPMITTEDVRSLVDDAPGNAQLHLMEGGDHFIFDRPEVIRPTLDWLRAALGTSTSSDSRPSSI